MGTLTEAKEIIYGQYQRYPKLGIGDIIKALYQSEFGCAHFVADEKSSEKYLFAELGKMESDKGEGEFIEPIGKSFSRVHLRRLEENGLLPETLLKLFVITSRQRKTSTRDFEQKLGCLMDMCRQNKLLFSGQEAAQAVGGYIKEGMPAVHHTAKFSREYAPAYRVISSELCRYIPLYAEIDRLLAQKETVAVAIDGKCTSGKTTLAGYLGEIYGCNVFDMDSFFLQPHQRTPERLAQAGGNVDYERFKEEVLDNVGKAGGFSYRPYDCSLMRLAEPVKAAYKRLNVIEGVYSMHPSLAPAYDLKVLLEIDYDTQLKRLGKRNSAQMRERFINEWIPLENTYFEKMDIKNKCDMYFVAD